VNATSSDAARAEAERRIREGGVVGVKEVGGQEYIFGHPGVTVGKLLPVTVEDAFHDRDLDIERKHKLAKARGAGDERQPEEPRAGTPIETRTPIWRSHMADKFAFPLFDPTVDSLDDPRVVEFKELLVEGGRIFNGHLLSFGISRGVVVFEVSGEAFVAALLERFSARGLVTTTVPDRAEGERQICEMIGRQAERQS
jgi:hypothetical protein